MFFRDFEVEYTIVNLVRMTQIGLKVMVFRLNSLHYIYHKAQSQFPQGKPCFLYREPLFSLQGPCFHYMDFPVNVLQGLQCMLISSGKSVIKDKLVCWLEFRTPIPWTLAPFLMPCPSIAPIGPKLTWTIQIVLDGNKLFWSGPYYSGRVQIILFWFKLYFSGLIFIIWTCPKWFGSKQNELDPSKTIGTQTK